MNAQSLKQQHIVRNVGMCLLLGIVAGGVAQAQGLVLSGANGQSLPPGLGDALIKSILSPSNNIEIQPGKPIDPQAGNSQAENSSLPPINKSIFDNMSKITLSPAAVTVGKRGTIVLTVSNPNANPIPVDFVVQASKTGAGAALAGWIRDVPQGMVVAPGETRTVTLHVTPPADAAPGRYAADIVVYFKPTVKIDPSTDLSGDVVTKFFADTTARGFPRGAYRVTKVTYTIPDAR